MGALQSQPEHGHALVNAGLLEGIDDRHVSGTRAFDIVPWGRDYQLPLLKLRCIGPFTESHGDARSIEVIQYLRFDEPIFSYQRCLIHVSTPSDDSKESTMSLPLSPVVS